MGAFRWLAAAIMMLAGCEKLLGLAQVAPPGSLSPWTTVAAGASHTCGVRSDGSLWCWGSNAASQLGLGAAYEVDRPSRVGTATWKTVATSMDTTCGIQSDGSLWCWGRTSEGQTGVGTTGVQESGVGVVLEPEQVGTGWQTVVAGWNHSCGIQDDGSLWCWGSNSAGQIGAGVTGVIRPSPVQVGASTDWVRVATGNQHTCAIDHAGALWCWGADGQGQLGDGANADQDTPRQIAATGWTAIAAFGDRTCGITSDQRWLCWGGGNNRPSSITEFGHEVDGWVDVAANNANACALRDDGFLWCVGPDDRGQLGPNGSVGDQGEPEPVVLPGTTWTELSLGFSHTCAIDDRHALSCWGADGHGQVGDGNGSRLAPVAVAGTWKHPAAGYYGTCALAPDGRPYCSGRGNEGQVGDGFNTDRATFVPIAGLGPSTQMAHGEAHACALAADGSLSCWGRGFQGALGLGDQSSTSVPALVPAGPWQSVATTYDHTCAIATNGKLWCWGRNDNGQVSNSALANPVTSAFEVDATDGPWAIVAASAFHSCAINTAGRTFCWGTSADGRLAFGPTNPSAIEPPTAIDLGGAQVSMIATGAGHTCAWSAGSAALCWGYGADGELGVGGLGDREQPTPIVGLTWNTLATGANHTCGIASDGSLWCWGYNGRGQVGDGTLVSRDIPVRIGGDVDWREVTAGADHTCATKTDSSLWCWGADDYGQLADGLGWTDQLVRVP